MGTNKSDRVTINVRPDQKQRWQEEANKRGKSLPEFIRHCVETYLILMDKLNK